MRFSILKDKVIKSARKNGLLLLMTLPVIIYFVIFRYGPMYGMVIAFQKYSITKGILGSQWVGLYYFKQFFNSIYFGRLIRNTLLLSVYSIIFGFPFPIMFAFMLNEINNRFVKKTFQTISYLPYFISTVVVVSIMKMLLSLRGGAVNEILISFGREPINFFMSSNWFRPLYIISGIWQKYGWESIIYLAALSGIDPALYEAAQIDGSNKMQNIFYITLPSIAPTVIILLILRLGQVMNMGFEKILLMYSPSIYSTADVIQTFTYRRGVLDADYSFGAAVGVFNAVLNLIILLSVNKISKRISEVSLW